MRTFFGLTWVDWVNFILLQWLWLRLVYAENEDGYIVMWGLFIGVVPSTGWWSPYIGPWKRVWF